MSEVTLNIGGKRVKVGADFLNLSPEQQQATVDEIAGTLGGGAPENPEAAGISQAYQEAITPQQSTYGGQFAGAVGRGAMNVTDMAPRGPIEMLTDTLGITEAGAERDRYRPAADAAVERLVGEEFDPNYYWTNAVGENLGAGLLGAPAAAASRVRAGASLASAGWREGSQQIAGAVGSTIGAEAGGELAARTLGEDYRAMGALGGSVAGGGAANLAPEAGARTTRRMFGRSETGVPSRELGGAMERQGITPTPGVVGGKFLAGTENLTDQLPVIGTNRRTDRQYDEFGRALNRGVEKVRGANQPIGAENTPQLGERVREIAANTATRRTNEVGDAEEAIRAKIGGDTKVDVSKVRVRLRELGKGQIGATKSLLQSYDKLLRKGNVTYDQLQSLRTQVGQAVKNGNLEGGLRKQIYDAIEEAQFDAAQTKDGFKGLKKAFGKPTYGEELRQTKEQTRRAFNWDDSPNDGGGDLAYMRKLQDKERASSIFNEIFGGSGRLDQRGIEGISYLHNADPEAASAVTAEVIQMMGRTKPGSTNIDRVWSPNNFATFWDRLDPQAKTIMTNRNPEAIAIFDDLSLIGKAFRSKESMANRSNSFNLQMAAGLINWSLVGNLPGLAAQGAAMRGMTSQKMAQVLIREDPTMARLFARYGSSGLARALNEMYNQSYNSETTEYDDAR